MGKHKGCALTMKKKVSPLSSCTYSRSYPYRQWFRVSGLREGYNGPDTIVERHFQSPI